MRRQDKYAQVAIEYVVLFLVVIIVLLLFMGLYLRNSLSGAWRGTADSFGQGETYLPFGNTNITQDKINIQ